ncbi:MAG: DUF4962 domain-containing protein, partial [Verrucomicrobiae bacterium]|nr:DUF4962 domain-containing protein [Verrucomicrobiae bacterium]
PWAMFNPHVKLAAGKWYWQYRASNSAEWSPVFQFRVEPGIRQFVTLSAEKMLTCVPAERPRVLAEAKQLAALRKRLAVRPEAKTFISRAERLVDAKLPDVSQAQPKQKGTTAYEQRQFAKWASKAFANDIAEEVAWLAPAYLITGDKRYQREIMRRGLFVAELDPDGVTAPTVSDFADGACMRVLGLTYDLCYDVLSPAERSKLEAAIRARGERFFARTVNRLETLLGHAHIWQHILTEFTEMALAVQGDMPEADLWLAYAYELWVNRFPPLGGDDGGWAEGMVYFGSNIDTMLFMPALWGRLTGVNFFDLPWYRNAPYFHLYCWPPGSASDGFGDGSERADPPPAGHGVFFEALAAVHGNPYARWYADRVLGDRDKLKAEPLLLWRRLTLPGADRLPSPRPPADLPLSRLFRDVGVASMHTDLTDASRDLMIGFRCSPYGAYGHAHPCQNAFNLNFAGKRLFANSGYYIAYGDAHFKGWYSNTRGHNCVLIDDKGQGRGTEAWGTIRHHLEGRLVSYCQGDASHAYPGTGLTLFKRHLALLRPNVVVIYDDLAAERPAQWSWLLHSPEKLAANSQCIGVASSFARARATLVASVPLMISIDDKFDPPAVNWRDKKSGKQPARYPDQWHATVKPARKTSRMRFLAVIQVERPDGTPLQQAASDAQGRIRIGPWRIEAALDVEREASLAVTREDGGATLKVSDATGASLVEARR